MKRCPTCNRTYTDDAQRFCLDDGATLLEETAAPFDPQATIAMTGAQTTGPPSNPYGSGAGQSQPTPSWTPQPSSHSFTPPAPKRKIWPWLLGGAAMLIIGVVGLIIVIALLASSGSNSNSNNSNSRANSNSNSNSNKSNTNTTAQTTKVITSTDGHSQVNVPNSWKTTDELNAKATLQASDVPNHLYLIVLTDEKGNYRKMDLETHSNQTLSALTNAVTDMSKVGPTNLTINGNPALQYEVRGEINNVNIVYLHTTVETDEHFQQIIAWTVQSEYDKQKDTLQDIIQSFKETGR